MRNLKKILALVLSLVMTFSVMTVASAAFKDAADVSGAYTDAVDLLDYLGVFRGYEDGTFKPQGDITRAEVATIIYRIDTGDVTDTHKDIYSDYNRFADVKSNDWFAGYVNYCANAEFVKGRDENTFDPNGKVTGYEVLAMILRVVGYDQNNEFSGSEWKIQVASTAQQLGITKNIASTTLNAYATRELVAELLWRACFEAPQVTYNMLLQGYNQYKDAVPTALSEKNPTINEENWKIQKYTGNDAWGRPGYGYFHDANLNGEYDETPAEDYDTGIFYTYTPDATYNVAVDQCTIVKDTGLKGVVDHYINGVKYTNTITATHNVVNHIEGEQGTIVEIYKAAGIVVEIDTYLAQMVDYQELKTDKKGHVTQYPYDFFNIYGAPVEGLVAVYGNNFEYGAYYLVNYNEAKGFVAPYAVAESVDGKQTHIWWNAEKHTIEKVDYLDNANYSLDAAGFDKDTAYTWFFDTYGNVIGSEEIYVPATAKQYAVVHAAQWVNGVGQYGYTLAKIQYMDGTIVEDAVIASMYDATTEKYVAMQYAGAYPEVGTTYTFENGYAYTTMQYNLDTEAHLYEVSVNANGTLNLKQVTDEIAEVEIKKGVSQLEDTAVYTDSKTIFAYWVDTDGDRYVDTLKIVEGYNNGELVKKMKGLNVDYVLNAKTGFAQIIYVPATGTLPGATDTDLEKLVYFTNETTCYALKDQFIVYGVCGTDGKMTTLTFDIDAFGSERETALALDAMVKAYKDTLAVVTYSKLYGTVSSVAPIFGEVSNVDSYGTAKLVTYGNYTFFNREVLKIGTLALNIIASTGIYNAEGEAITFSDMANLYYNNLYVVYKGTNAVAIFVTPTAGSTVGAYMEDLTAADFRYEVAGLTYTIEADATAGELTYVIDKDTTGVAELDTIIAESAVVKAIEMAGTDVVVTVSNKETTETKATYEVVLTCGDETATVELTFAVKVVETEE